MFTPSKLRPIGPGSARLCDLRPASGPRASLALLILGALAAAQPAAAGTILTSEQLTASLVSEQAVVRPGDSLSVALRQEPAPGWHTYWRNPGDSGQPPLIDWRLPADARASPPQWPAPERIPVGPLVNYGYSDATALISEIAVPAGWAAGTPFPVAAEVELLVCAEICIPVAGSLSLSVPTGAETLPAPGQAALFAAARARQPLPGPWPARFHAEGDGLQLTLAGAPSDFSGLEAAYFFADDWGIADHAGAQSATVDDGGITVSLPRGQAAPGASLSGVLALAATGDAGPARQAFRIEAEPGLPAAPTTGRAAAPALALLLGFALLGGAILNLMPCVFPILAMKALGLAGHAHAGRRERLVHGLSYAAGVVASFLAFAVLLLAARAGGAAVGWGFQLQSPLVVAALAYVATAIGLSLSGLFEIGGRLAGVGDAWASRSGHVGSFATGVLAALVAAPCTAPFMAAAAGGALLLPAPQALAVFSVMGLGLALPYLLLTALPSLARVLPRPGPWMRRFRQALAFPMYATAAWLIWVLAQQAGADAAFLATLGLILLALALWCWPIGLSRGIGARLRAASFLVAFAAAGGLLAAAGSQPTASGPAAATASAAEPFSPARLAQLRAEGRAVLVNMTAAWCISCKVNERVALSGAGFAETLERHDIAYLLVRISQTGDRPRRYSGIFQSVVSLHGFLGSRVWDEAVRRGRGERRVPDLRCSSAVCEVG